MSVSICPWHGPIPARGADGALHPGLAATRARAADALAVAFAAIAALATDAAAGSCMRHAQSAAVDAVAAAGAEAKATAVVFVPWVLATEGIQIDHN